MDPSIDYAGWCRCLAIALTDHLLQLIFKGQHGIVQEKAGEGH